MKQIKLGRTNIIVNRIGMGGIPIQRLTAAEADSVLLKAIDAGINFYDTARIYTDSEIKLGRILSRNRDKVVIATKTYARSGEKVEIDIDTSLKNLKTDYIDFYLCHNISSEEEISKVLAKDGAVEILLRAKEKGKLKHIGFSAHKPWIAMKLIQQYDWDIIQVPFNIIETGSAEEVIPFAGKKNIPIIGMKPIAGGVIKAVKLHLRWILTNGIAVVIPGIDSVSQVGEDISVLENLNPLNEEEYNILLKEKEALGQYFCRRCEYCMPCPQGLNISFLHLLRFYYFSYDLKEWAWERINALPKSYRDCAQCSECISKCPYELKTPELFKEAWEEILKDRQGQK